MHPCIKKSINDIIRQAAIDTNTRTHIQRHIPACTQPSSHTHTKHIQTHTQTDTYTYAHNPDWMVDCLTGNHTRAYMHIQAEAYTHAYIHTSTDMRAYTHNHIHNIHTHHIHVERHSIMGGW